MTIPKGYGKIGGWFVKDGVNYRHANPMVCGAIKKIVEEENASSSKAESAIREGPESK